jgi:hypothetical protein
MLSRDTMQTMTPAQVGLYCSLLRPAYQYLLAQTGLVCGADAEALRDQWYSAIKEVTA